MERLTALRHAESVFNARGVVNGDPRVPGGLTERGREQARRVRTLLASEQIDLCATTSFQRCIETADILLEGREVPRLIVAELNDPPVGELELHPYAELEAWRARHGPDAFVPGISSSEYFERIRRGFSRLAERPEDHVLAVIHGEGIWWLPTALGRPATPEQGEPVSIRGATVREMLQAARGDAARVWSA